MPQVSVIVPVYNVEKYLPQCLDSILAQTLGDIEVICVDDGSTDRSGRIIDQYAARDRRVRVLHRPNAGYGAAMNAGLDAARGDYIGIVESDDCIEKEMYQTLYAAAVRDDLDLVKSDMHVKSIDDSHILVCKNLRDWFAVGEGTFHIEIDAFSDIALKTREITTIRNHPTWDKIATG